MHREGGAEPVRYETLDRLSLPDELASLYGGAQRDDRCCR